VGRALARLRGLEAMMGQAPDLFQLVVDGSGELKGVDRFSKSFELSELGGVGLFRSD
jgi:hypothetical protein